MRIIEHKPLRFGVITLQHIPYAVLLDRWQQAEALGFDSAWMPDHFTSPFNPQEPWFEAWTTLAALACQTKQLRLGLLVSAMSYHTPTLLAKQALTIDHLSQGRLNIGLGAGGRTSDHTMTGTKPWLIRERVKRFEEAVQLIDQLLRCEHTTYRGTYYQVEEAIMRPAPIQKPRPPFTLAAHGAAMLRIVAAYADTWNSYGGWELSASERFTVTQQRSQLLDSYCLERGRDPQEITRSILLGDPRFPPDQPWHSFDRFCDIVERYRAIGFTEFIFYWPREEEQCHFESIVTKAIPMFQQ